MAYGGIRFSRIAALAIAITLVTGCGKSTKTTGPVGDDSGERLLAFTTTRGSGTTSEYDVVLYDIDLAQFHDVTGMNSSFSQSEPCIADDGSVVVFASTRAGDAGGSDLWVYDRLTQKIRIPAGLNSSANETWPRFTHDSKRIAFVRDSLGVKRVRLYDGAGAALVALPGLDAPGAGNDEAPAPDLTGDRIAFQSDRSGAAHVLVWNRTGGIAALPALAGDSLDVEPSLSSNGRWLAFASNRSGGAGGWDVYLYDLQASAYVRLPRCNTAGDERHPSVSADGSVLFFQSRTGAGHHYGIWSYSLSDSTRLQPTGLAGSSADDREPCVRWR
jgi:Tol biopolymer transport system component